MSARCVIGANFGDEGKGLMTDFHVSESRGKAVVVRFNGGAQAGHTVTTPDGHRHVFKHFGSGTLQGASTFLSKFFIASPMFFFQERGLLQKIGINPYVMVDPRCLIATPWDVLVNQILERTREPHKRHGSCGYGINETVSRSENSYYRLTAADLQMKSVLDMKLRRIMYEYTPQRLSNLGLTDKLGDLERFLTSEHIYRAFFRDCELFAAETTSFDSGILCQFDDIVFEGAQGLLLDEGHRWFPHVTRSKTGIANAIVVAAEAGLTGLDVTYVTRAYLTRHGAGPMPNEIFGNQPPTPMVKDETNIPNEFQGTLRFGRLDADLLAETIQNDLRNAPSNFTIRPELAVTCMDQMYQYVDVTAGGQPTRFTRQDFAEAVGATAGILTSYESWGPTRADVKRLEYAKKKAINF